VVLLALMVPSLVSAALPGRKTPKLEPLIRPALPMVHTTASAACSATPPALAISAAARMVTGLSVGLVSETPAA